MTWRNNLGSIKKLSRSGKFLFEISIVYNNIPAARFKEFEFENYIEL